MSSEPRCVSSERVQGMEAGPGATPPPSLQPTWRGNEKVVERQGVIEAAHIVGHQIDNLRWRGGTMRAACQSHT